MTTSSAPVRRPDPESDRSRDDESWDSFDPCLDPIGILVAIAIFCATAALSCAFEAGT